MSREVPEEILMQKYVKGQHQQNQLLQFSADSAEADQKLETDQSQFFDLAEVQKRQLKVKIAGGERRLAVCVRCARMIRFLVQTRDD